MGKNVDPETGIWSMHIAKKRHKIDMPLARAIYSCYHYPLKAVDVGCGSGLYCQFFSSLGWNITGFEGTPEISSLGIYLNIIEVDLVKPIDYKGAFDFTLCLEVGEHIPEKHERQFIDNVCGLSTNHLVLSWAVPGQYSASGHVNCRPNEYVVEEFTRRGFDYDEVRTDLIKGQATFNWFKNTLMCFDKNG